MTLRTTLGSYALALALVAALGGQAEAQIPGPSLSAAVQGNVVSLQWTGLPGATGYTVVVGSAPGLANVGVMNVPGSITSGQVPAPSGVYYIRVRATAGSLVSDFSNEAVAAVGGSSTCQQPVSPVVTTSASGGTINFSWSAVPGVIGYQIQYSRTPGNTEATDQTAGTSFSRYIGMPGTFYARVVAVSACGSASSPDVSFTLDTPTPTQLGPNEILFILRQTAALYPRAFQHAHRDGDPERWDYIILAGKRLFQASGGLVGLNWRRAVPGDLSMDGITITGADGRYYFADVISGAGGSNPLVVYETPGANNLLRDSRGNYAPHGFANPTPLRTHFNYGVQ